MRTQGLGAEQNAGLPALVRLPAYGRSPGVEYGARAGNARTASSASATRQRAQWADAAKGACIILVVLWHVIVKDYLQISWHIGVPVPSAWGTLGEQFLPLRMPVFFTISGVFAANAVNRPWRVLGRSRIAKFLYLYAIWLLIHTAILAAVPNFPTDRADSVLDLVEQLTITPSNLWYLYALALYFAFAKAVRRVPRPVILAAAAALSLITAAGVLATPGDRGGFYQNLVFFLGGLYLKPYVERWAATATNRRLVLTFVVYAAALTAMAAAGAQRWVGVWLAVSITAVAFGITAAAHASRWRTVGDALAVLGRRTLPIYVIHMPLLALLHRFLVGPMSGLSGDGQAFVSVGYPIVLTAVVMSLSFVIHRGLMAVHAKWLFELPGSRGMKKRRTPAVDPVPPPAGARPEKGRLTAGSGLR